MNMGSSHRIARTALLVVMSVVALSGCNRFEARQLIRKGNEYFKAQQYEDALKLYRDAQILDPSEVRLHKFIGYAAMAQYQPGSTHEKDLALAKLAIDSFKGYLATGPEDQEKISQFLVTMYMNSNQTFEAIGFFKTYLGTHPDDEQAINSIGMLYAKEADFKNTVECSRSGSTFSSGPRRRRRSSGRRQTSPQRSLLHARSHLLAEVVRLVRIEPRPGHSDRRPGPRNGGAPAGPRGATWLLRRDGLHQPDPPTVREARD